MVTDQCQYHHKDDDYSCPHPVYKDEDYCVFHSDRVEEKQEDFHTALEEYITQCENDDTIEIYSFSGFIFPEISFWKKVFIKTANFSSSQFSGSADFRNSQFSRSADFRNSLFSESAYFINSQFSGSAYFENSQFRGLAFFENSQFSGSADFVSSQFSIPASFSSSLFSRSADFRNSQFSESANFFANRFSGSADFMYSQFSRSVIFSSSQFSGSADFRESQFSGSAYFENSQFSKSANFRYSHFSESVYFKYSQFSKSADFRNSQFTGDVSFNETQFNEVKFKKTSFLKHCDFSHARFHNTLEFDECRFRLINQISVENVNFENSVLEEANLWDINKIKDYSFKNSFLLSISFAEKELINCDFTAAVMDSVRTRGWILDDKTVKNSRYIYTDYVIEEAEDGKRDYMVKEESRVPADGDFGEGDNENFTIKEYLLEPYKWNYAVHFPSHIRTPMVNYVRFFTDFIHITKGKMIEIHTKTEGKKIRVEFSTESKEDKVFIEKEFKDYFNNIGKDTEQLIFDFKNPNASEFDKELLELEYKSQIRNLQDKLYFLEKLLEKENKINELLEFQQMSQKIKENPHQLFIEAKPVKRVKCKAPYFILNADLAGYSNAVKERKELFEKIQDFLMNQKENIIKNYPQYEEGKLEGDCIKLFFKDGINLIHAAQDLIYEFKKLNRDNDTGIAGFRIVLGYDRLIMEERGRMKDFAGMGIIDTVRVDQPMKEFLKEEKQSLNQIWCTESFKRAIDAIPDHKMSFEKLPAMNLAKGHGENVILYSVKT